MVGGFVLELVVLGSVRKQDEKVVGSKPVSSTPPWPLHQFLPPRLLPCLSSYPDFL